MNPSAPSQPTAPAEGEGRRRRSRLWYVPAAAAVFVGFVVMVKLLGGSAGGGREGLLPGEADYFAPAPASAPSARDRPLITEGQARQDLRRLMVGILMAAAEDGEYEHPENQTPEQRRQFLAELFGVSAAQRGGQVPADMLPPGAQVLAVLEDPANPGARMVLVRVPRSIDQAMADFRRQYVEKQGWKTEDYERALDPKAQPDRGWLVGFRRERAIRFVYARPRASGEETLAAIYDQPY